MPPKRMSISSVFPGVELPTSSNARSRESSPTRQKDLSKSIRLTFTRNWPQWRSSRTNQYMKLTIRMDGMYRQMADVERVETDFHDAEGVMSHVMDAYHRDNFNTNESVCEWIELCMIDAIFGSNAIERVGHGYIYTLDICRRVFRGQMIEDVIDEKSPEYQQGLHDLKQIGMKNDDQSDLEIVLRSRKEVIQHAKAMEHMVSSIVHNNELLTQDLILKTHAVLCSGITNDDGTPSEEYAGRYREDYVAVKHRDAKKPHKFMHPKAVPGFMQTMCERYKADVARIEESGVLDPFALAARYSYVFVNIHPFADGNGRMCRIILNTILLKYAGLCIPIGEEDDRSRQEYLDLMSKGSMNFLDDSFEDYRITGHEGLAGLLIKKATIKYREVILTLQIKE